MWATTQFVLVALGLSSAACQLIVPNVDNLSSNLRGTFVNIEKKNSQSILYIEFLKKECIIAKGMHCVEPETVCIAIAPEELVGQCFYNNHTNELFILPKTSKKEPSPPSLVLQMFFEANGDMTLTNNTQDCSDGKKNNYALMESKDTISFKKANFEFA
jgi:hypothetical protein